MTNQWRPDGWVNKYKKDFNSQVEWNLNDIQEAYEQGADAILKAIWGLAEESPTKTFTFDANIHQIYGVKND